MIKNDIIIREAFTRKTRKYFSVLPKFGVPSPLTHTLTLARFGIFSRAFFIASASSHICLMTSYFVHWGVGSLYFFSFMFYIYFLLVFVHKIYLVHLYYMLDGWVRKHSSRRKVKETFPKSSFSGTFLFFLLTWR